MKNTKKKTALDELYDKLSPTIQKVTEDLLIQKKRVFKKQIMEAYDKGKWDVLSKTPMKPHDYYESVYGGDK